ncbi:MAG: choice-of-anchor tandem repeat GloVer-containing protein [Terriglobales bacterium]
MFPNLVIVTKAVARPALFAALLCLAAAHLASAQSLTTLYAFAGGVDGGNTQAGLVQDSSGNLYGTTSYGGGSGEGTIFEITPAGSKKVLYSFPGGPHGSEPRAALLSDGTGDLYGTAFSSTKRRDCMEGCGVVFELSAKDKQKVLHKFTGKPDGANPITGLVRDANGNFFGTTSYGGDSIYGTVFKVTSSGTETVVHSFNGQPDGMLPGDLVLDAQGNLYGTTYEGGNSTSCYGGCGTLFEVASSGTETVLYNFSGGQDGKYPSAGLIEDAQGNLYGTTMEGGAYGFGVVFEVTASATETVLYSFSGGADGSYPAMTGSLVRDGQGNLYGTTVGGGTSGFGTIFKVSPTGTETVLYSFTGGADGASPSSALIEDAQGNFYGTTQYGGVASGGAGYGTVFKLIP